ncbi:MAG TPA: hypothetical protein VGD76_13835, partial [Ramlibacter sp.]
AAAMAILSLAIGRYEFVIGGQLVPMFKGTWVIGLAEYAPSFTEWMVALSALCLAFVIYGVGEWMLRLSASPSTRQGDAYGAAPQRAGDRAPQPAGDLPVGFGGTPA